MLLKGSSDDQVSQSATWHFPEAISMGRRTKTSRRPPPLHPQCPNCPGPLATDPSNPRKAWANTPCFCSFLLPAALRAAVGRSAAQAELARLAGKRRQGDHQLDGEGAPAAGLGQGPLLARRGRRGTHLTGARGRAAAPRCSRVRVVHVTCSTRMLSGQLCVRVGGWSEHLMRRLLAPHLPYVSSSPDELCELGPRLGIGHFVRARVPAGVEL